MPGASVAVLPPSASSTPTSRKAQLPAERKYKCQFCNRAFSRSEHRSRHERSHTKERPFKCAKCRSTFVRRDLLLRHDRTVHAKDGGVPLHSDSKRRATSKLRGPSKSGLDLDASALEQLETSSDGVFDVEAAAMLMADFHHKATASVRSGSPYEGSPSIAFSQTGTPLGEHASVAYSAASVTTPSAWDSFPTSAPGESKYAPPLRSQLKESISSSTVNGLVPALQSLVDSLPSSTVGTPITSSPTVAAKFPPKPAQVASEDERQAILDNIREADREGVIPEGFHLPAISSLNRYLSTYFGLFHHHLPFLHPSSFRPADASPALLLAILSIGALYAFDQDQAYMLHVGSKLLVTQFLQHKSNFSSRRCPLWTMQGTLLNMIFASWSGDPKGLEWACSIKSLLANMVAGNRYELKLRQDARGGKLPTRAEWVHDEGCRRTYYAVYIFFGLLTLTFNHTPAINFNEFEDVQLPSTEALWNHDPEDEAAWQDHLGASPSAVTFLVAHDKLFQGETLRYSAFGTRVMINALFLEVWYHKRSPEALQDVVTEYKLRLALETWEKSLDICEPEAAVSSLSAPHKGHPLVFNARAMFRNARVRLEVDLKSVQEALRYHDSYEVAAAMTVGARDRVKRSSEMLKVIEECYDCIETAVRQGIRWAARTSPTNWSIEHPLCGMDLMIVLSHWLYRLEHDEEPATEEETALYNKIRILFAKSASSDEYTAQLGSTVARLWGSMLDEVVVWGITRLMGESFRLHARGLVGYMDDMEASSTVSTPSMISPEGDEESVY